MKGFKGFDKDLKCRGMRYAIGETKTHDGEASLCEQGLHFCEHPLDTWSYYKPGDGSRYAEVEADGVSGKTGPDSKRVAKSVIVKAEIKLPMMLKAAVDFVFNKVKATTGDSAHSATTGYSAHSATTGNYAHSEARGRNAIAASLGYRGRAKGAKGSWLVLAEYNDTGKIIAMGIVQVRGKIKPDTWYELKNTKFTEIA